MIKRQLQTNKGRAVNGRQMEEKRYIEDTLLVTIEEAKGSYMIDFNKNPVCRLKLTVGMFTDHGVQHEYHGQRYSRRIMRSDGQIAMNWRCDVRQISVLKEVCKKQKLNSW